MSKLAQQVRMDSCILTEDVERRFTNTKHTNVICRGIAANESKQRAAASSDLRDCEAIIPCRSKHF